MARQSINSSFAHRLLASQIAAARLASGLTQAQLAREIGRDQTFISKVESQQRRLGVIEFVQVTNALRVDPLTILDALSEALRQKC